jgi:putative heme degradation protein
MNEIQKLLFDKHFFARLLKAHNFDTSKAILVLKKYLEWRKSHSIDTILVSAHSNQCRTLSSLNTTRSKSCFQMDSTR